MNEPPKGVPFWESFVAYAAILQGMWAPMSNMISINMEQLIMGWCLRDYFRFIIDYKYIAL